MAREEARPNFTMQVLREEDYLWRLEGSKQELMVGILASTEHLTVGRIEIRPGTVSDVQVHAGDESLYFMYLREH